ncbi:MAG: aromatic amino acid ammonia-lyase [Prevotellaceae bacterium]|jgi:histidine ammonia-lyase|nr:aromatic amino acid ammonia-lyase [Prevotellaceae bacterium]
MNTRNTIVVDGNSMTIKNFCRLASGDADFRIEKSALRRVAECHGFLERFSSRKLIYGISTGFGPMAQYRIDETDRIDLQYNIIRSHSAGLGDYLPPDKARAVLFNLLNAMLRGFSGVAPALIRVVEATLRADILPCIPMHGGVGASGDLVQMAHVALCLIGEGEAMCEGAVAPAAELFRRKGVEPLRISLREGIAVMNGTTAMTALAALNLRGAQIALEWSLALSACLNETVASYDDHYSPGLNRVRRQSGQQVVARAMGAMLKDSERIRSRAKLYENGTEEPDVAGRIAHKVQPYYSLRCVPQILGPIYETLDFSCRIVENELNSVTDNPVIDAAECNVYHGGNFHGDYISLEMDKLKLAMTRLGMMSERQFNYLMNPAENECLPPFLNRGKPGLNFGFQGAGFTATSTAAENQALAASHYIHSIPNNNDNQDIVSMGFNAAVAAGKTVDNVFEILAIQAAALIQAIDILGCRTQLSSRSRTIHAELRAVFAELKNDRPTRKELEGVREYLRTNPLNLL